MERITTAVKSVSARLTRGVLQQVGIELRRMPVTLLEQPSAVLRPTLDDVVARVS